MSDQQWYFVEDGQRTGPVGHAEIAEMALHGVIGPDTLVWCDGMADWAEAEAHFDFGDDATADMPTAMPPVPPARAQANADGLGFPLSSATPQANAQPRGGVGPDGLYVGAPSRGFTEAIRVCLSKFVTFSGRASRSEYWFFYLFTVIVSIVTSILDTLVFGTTMAVSPINAILSLLLLLPTIAVTVRRLHDTDRSGWWLGGFFIAILVIGAGMAMLFESTSGSDQAFLALAGVGFIAFIYSIALFVFMCLRGTLGPNRFG